MPRSRQAEGRTLAGLIELHRLGRDCRLTAARDVLHYFGFLHSPAMVYGLSSSYHFTYRRAEKSMSALLFPDLGDVTRDYFLPVSGQRLEVFENLAYLFNGTLIQGEGASLETLIGIVRGYLHEELPVLVAVCQARVLNRIGTPISWPPYLKVAGFGSHWIQVVGLDEERRTVTVLESNRREPLELSFEDLQEARGYGEDQPDFLMKSRGRWAVLLPSAAPPPLAELIHGALVKVVYQMSDTESPGSEEHGLHALRQFALEFPSWPETLPLAKYKASLFMMRTASEGLLSASLGRGGFGIFLRRAAGALAHQRLNAAASEYADAGEAWGRLVRRIDERVLDPEGLSVLAPEDVGPLCADIESREVAAFEYLASAVRTL